jgi:prophage antirepressor-like protein
VLFIALLKFDKTKAPVLDLNIEVIGKIPKNSPKGGRPRIDYHLTLQGAMHIAMISNTEKGFEVRDYFIECEERYRALREGRRVASTTSPAAVMPDPLRVASPVPDLSAGLPRVFDFEGHPVRVVVQDGLAWFAVRDMTAALGYSDDPPHGAGRHLDGVPANCRRTLRIPTPGGKQKMRLISEAGLRPFLDAKLKPAVPRVRRWLADAVLPALRGAEKAGLPAASLVAPPTFRAAPGALRTFEFEGRPVRAVVADGRPWFVARDVLRGLGYLPERLKSVTDPSAAGDPGGAQGTSSGPVAAFPPGGDGHGGSLGGGPAGLPGTVRPTRGGGLRGLAGRRGAAGPHRFFRKIRDRGCRSHLTPETALAVIPRLAGPARGALPRARRMIRLFPGMTPWAPCPFSGDAFRRTA